MNKGFSSVYVILCLAALVLFLLCTFELCTGYAAGSICENVCTIAGESVLSEYQPQLQKRYGIFALASYEQKLESLSSYYIRENLNGIHLLVKPKLKDCRISCEETLGLDTAALADQIESIGWMLLGKDALDAAGVTDLMKSLFSPFVKGKDKEVLEALQELPAASQSTDGGKSASELMQDYNEAMDPDLGCSDGRSLASVPKDTLPTALLGVKPASSLLRYAAEALLQDGISEGAVLQSRYIAEVCSDLSHPAKDTILALETEYVLFGKTTDRENEAEMKDALFKVRTAFDLAKNLRSEEKMASYAAAAAAFPAVPQPVAVLVLACIDAARQAKGEVTLLCSGGCVEILPLPAAGRAVGTYRDYAVLLLMLLPQQTRMARLMDVMQANVAYMDGAAFAFRDYCYGFTMRAEFEKRTLAGLLPEGVRRGTVEQVHIYR